MNTDIFDYTELDNQIIITGLKNDTIETSIIIPKKINGKPVTQIAERAFKKSHITGVQIGENIKNIKPIAKYLIPVFVIAQIFQNLTLLMSKL